MVEYANVAITLAVVFILATSVWDLKYVLWRVFQSTVAAWLARLSRAGG